MAIQLVLLAGFFVIFGVLSRLYPCNPGQPKFVSRETPTDVIYVLCLLLLSGAAAGGLVAGTVALVYGPDAPAVLDALRAGQGALAGLPLWAQALLILVVSDVIQYWLHRAFHWAGLWPFHAVHHSAKAVDWITTFRVHPVNYLLYSTTVSALVVLAGFSPVVIAILAPLNMAHAALVHSNLNWTFGPFRYVLASPVFHRWHHVDDPDVRDKNFAPTFPVLDLLFGTFHMPKGEVPQVFGAEGVPAEGFLDQMAYPFKALLAARRAAVGRAGPASQAGG